MKVLTVVGARPQFIKTAVVSRALRALPGVQEVLVHTGQHYDDAMSAVFFRELDIPTPDVNLNIGSGGHGAQTGRMLEALEATLLAERPDWVLVYGDTNSTMAGALAAAKLCLPVAHVEAGVRSGNRHMPEEINRIVTDHVAALLFPPTDDAVTNLRHEGVDDARVFPVGDVMYDAARYYGAKAERESTVLRTHDLEPCRYVLATVHRQENTDHPERLRAIFGGLDLLGRELPVVVPLHPRTREALARLGTPAEGFRHLRIIPPVGYLDMLMLEQHAYLVATDSGGIQKEAFFYRTPCLTLRTETEYVELRDSGYLTLFLPESPADLPPAVHATVAARPTTTPEPPFYGDGHASEQIARILTEYGA